MSNQEAITASSMTGLQPRPVGVKRFALRTDLWIKALPGFSLPSSLGLGIPGPWEGVAWSGLAALPKQPATMLRESCRVFTELCCTWQPQLSVWQLWDPLGGTVRCKGAPRLLAGHPPGCPPWVGSSMGLVLTNTSKVGCLAT